MADPLFAETVALGRLEPESQPAYEQGEAASVVASRAATPAKSSQSWIHNPWTVTVAGGIVAAVVATLLIAWLT